MLRSGLKHGKHASGGKVTFHGSSLLSVAKIVEGIPEG